MTFTRFIVKNSMRNKRRTFLTVLSIGFSLLLLITLRSFVDFLFNPPLGNEADLRITVKRSTTFADVMPAYYETKLVKVPHVALVMPFQWFGGMYREAKYMFANIAVDPTRFWQMFPDIFATDHTKETFQTQRNAAVVGEELMSIFHWKVGDRVTLQGTMFPVNLDFEIIGTYRANYRSSTFFMRTDYLSEALGNPGTVGMFFLKADSAAAVPGIIDAVDEMFRNSPAETRTETEKAFILGFFERMGNIKLLMGSIAVVIVFTMLLVTASTMAMTIRERIREVAILKSMGFPRRTILVLILGEAAFISLLGGLLGCTEAFGLGQINLYTITMGFIERFRTSPETYLLALSIGLGIGVFSGLIPAIGASRMTITDAIRKLG